MTWSGRALVLAFPTPFEPSRSDQPQHHLGVIVLPNQLKVVAHAVRVGGAVEDAHVEGT